MKIAHPIKNNWQRIATILLSVGMGVLAFAFWNLRAEESYLPNFWPVWFGITALVVLAFALKPCSSILARLAGSMSVVAIASRLAGVFIRYTSTGLSGWRLWVGLIVYTIASVALARIWVSDVMPWQRRKHDDCEDCKKKRMTSDPGR